MASCERFQAFTARAFFLVHNGLTVYYTTVVLEPEEYHALFLLTFGIIVEGIFTVCRRGGKEPKWISSSAFMFLAATVPCIWLLELDRLDTFTEQQVQNTSTEVTVGEAIQVPGMNFTVTLPKEIWLEMIKQSFLGFVLLGRWLLPLGTMNRDQLSLLLFVYFAVASDIMELFQLFDDHRVAGNTLISQCILGVWTLSLFLFVIVLTMTRHFRLSRPTQQASRSSGAAIRRSTGSVVFRRSAYYSESEEDEEPNWCVTRCLSSDVWSILVTLILMDAPFLVIRLYVVFGLKVIEYNILFFLIKNFLIVLLSLYRLVIILLGKAREYKASRGHRPHRRPNSPI